jgi:hypothetical protein
MYPVVRALVLKVLDRAQAYEWSLQGFGMLRTYCPESDIRISIWHNELRTPGVSLIHTHPWNFQSFVAGGRIHNHKYWEASILGHDKALHYWRCIVKAGEGGGLEGVPQAVWLVPEGAEDHGPNVTYGQRHSDIHKTEFLDGTVTVCQRTMPPAVSDRDRAFVYWPQGESWVSAEPRPATGLEVAHAVRAARGRLVNPD